MNKQFLKRWSLCRDCGLCLHTRNHVIGHGSIPADVLFIGEAPGGKEDILGRPFVGPAGQLLRKQLDEVKSGRHHIFSDDPRGQIRFTYYITNIVACTPWTDDTRSSLRKPTKEEADACSERLDTIITSVKPKTIIYIGEVAKKFHKPPKGMPTLAITHPAAILRSGIAPESSISYHKVIQQLRDHLRKILQ